MWAVSIACVAAVIVENAGRDDTVENLARKKSIGNAALKAPDVTILPVAPNSMNGALAPAKRRQSRMATPANSGSWSERTRSDALPGELVADRQRLEGLAVVVDVADALHGGLSLPPRSMVASSLHHIMGPHPLQRGQEPSRNRPGRQRPPRSGLSSSLLRLHPKLDTVPIPNSSASAEPERHFDAPSASLQSCLDQAVVVRPLRRTI